MYPMKLIPAYKDYLWGGTRLEKIFQKHSGLVVTAESWELSCHPDGLCEVENGRHKGETLAEVLQEYPEYVKKGYQKDDHFPMMVKFIDAAKDLSVQVHPSDGTAIWEAGERGKAEMWYIVKAAPRSYIYWGFNRNITKEQLLELAESGEICDVMNKVYVQEGDVFYILPGTIHAIGQGCLIAEIQQSSNTTFRVYDYNRTDTEGKKRPLHLERAAEVLNYAPIIPDRTVNNNVFSTDAFRFSNIFECEYLRVSKIDCKKTFHFLCTEKSFYSFLVTAGEGFIRYNEKEYTFKAGDSYFLPAGMGQVELKGEFTALLSSV